MRTYIPCSWSICPHFLPVYDIIYQSPLLGCGFAQINSRCLNTFMSHQVCKKRNVTAPFQETFGKPMPERVGINHRRINAILYRQLFQLSRNTSCGYSFAETIQKDKAAVLLFFFQPDKGFVLQWLFILESWKLFFFLSAFLKFISVSSSEKLPPTRRAFLYALSSGVRVFILLLITLRWL